MIDWYNVIQCCFEEIIAHILSGIANISDFIWIIIAFGLFLLIECVPLKFERRNLNANENKQLTSSFRFCRRFERSSILRSKRSTRIAFAPFNFVDETFESTAWAPRTSPVFSSNIFLPKFRKKNSPLNLFIYRLFLLFLCSLFFLI